MVAPIAAYMPLATRHFLSMSENMIEKLRPVKKAGITPKRYENGAIIMGIAIVDVNSCDG